MIKFQQSQALTSHFESFWSKVRLQSEYRFFLKIEILKNKRRMIISHWISWKQESSWILKKFQIVLQLSEFVQEEGTLFPAWTDMDKAQNVFGLIESYAYDVIMMCRRSQ